MRKCLLLFLFASIFSYAQQADFSHIDFKKADSIALLHKGQSLKNLPVLTHKLTADLTTDVEKFRAIYTWVSTNIENDYNAYLRTRKNRKKITKDREAFMLWNNGFTPKVFEKLLDQKKTACTGYAFLIKELANLSDIDCKIIDGYGRTATLFLNDKSVPNHSWNAVSLHGKWYLCDATWSTGRTIITEEGPKFEFEYYDGYFLADPELFVKNHYPLDTKWTLLKEYPTFKDFIAGPIVYKDAFQLKMSPTIPQKMKLETLKDKEVFFKIVSQNNVSERKIGLLLNRGGSNKEVMPAITKNKNDYTLAYTFKKTGLYDTHIQVNDSIIASYVVRVKKK
ncbi:transglutaminase domain-containing protein [Maribacter sp. 2210JD10-5]|uniref:transglutaminase domain-containing protein n=1 Tax=Maribacter sp. 2210JD10-5 TaxID=3386272 RepID=UPI0039BC600F